MSRSTLYHFWGSTGRGYRHDGALRRGTDDSQACPRPSKGRPLAFKTVCFHIQDLRAAPHDVGTYRINHSYFLLSQR